mgnify:FL=1
MKNKSQTVRIPKGCLWKASWPCAQDSTGKKMYMCWPRIGEDMSWFKDVQDVLNAGDTPRYVTHQNGKLTWHFKLSCYHGGEGWWYDWDVERSADRTKTYRLFVPRTLQDHPDYLAPSDKKLE